MMEVIPAIDLRGGCCVRLVQGNFDREVVYSRDPVKMADYWQEQGASRLHLVDLDGARAGQPVNLALIKEVVSQLEIPVQLGGGIRSIKIMENYLATGVDRVILGTLALEKPELLETAVRRFGSERIVVAVDSRAGKVASRGWLETSEQGVEELIKTVKGSGVNIFIYTDISRDGMLSGPDFSGLTKLQQISGIELIASGGVASWNDLEKLAELGLSQVIIGQALYNGDISPDFARFKGLEE